MTGGRKKPPVFLMLPAGIMSELLLRMKYVFLRFPFLVMLFAISRRMWRIIF